MSAWQGSGVGPSMRPPDPSPSRTVTPTDLAGPGVPPTGPASATTKFAPLNAVSFEKWRFSPSAWCDACGWRPGLLGAAAEARRHAAATGHETTVEHVRRTMYRVTS